MMLGRRKLQEFLIICVISSIHFFFFSNFEQLTLFVFGYIWNWASSSHQELLIENQRYRYSLIRTVISFQKIILTPFKKTPEMIRRIIKALPAGLFWLLVIYINNSTMPWWAPFLGSLCFEIIDFEFDFLEKRNKTA